VSLYVALGSKGEVNMNASPNWMPGEVNVPLCELNSAIPESAKCSKFWPAKMYPGDLGVGVPEPEEGAVWSAGSS
jgi:hypothetical protein